MNANCRKGYTQINKGGGVGMLMNSNCREKPWVWCKPTDSVLMLYCSATVTNLQQKLEVMQTTNALMKEDLAISKNNIIDLQMENSLLREEKETLSAQTNQQLQVYNYILHLNMLLFIIMYMYII